MHVELNVGKTNVLKGEWRLLISVMALDYTQIRMAQRIFFNTLDPSCVDWLMFLMHIVDNKFIYVTVWSRMIVLSALEII